MNKTVGFYLRALVSLGVMFYLVSILEWQRIQSLLPTIAADKLAIAYALVFLLTFLSALRWTTLLKYFGIVQRVIGSLKFYLISMFYGAVLPGIIAGDLVRLGLSIKLHGAAYKGKLTIGILVERACGLISVLCIFSVMSLLAKSLIQEGDLPVGGASVAAIFIVLCAGFSFLALKTMSQNWLDSLGKRDGLLRRMALLLCEFRSLSIVSVLWILILSSSVNLIDIAASYYLAQALNLDVSIYVFLLIIPMTYVLTALPISLGGLGVREGVLTFFLVKVGVVASDAVTLALLIYLNKLAVGLIGGVIQLTASSVKNKTPRSSS